jgi:hypothetical protein
MSVTAARSDVAARRMHCTQAVLLMPGADIFAGPEPCKPITTMLATHKSAAHLLQVSAADQQAPETGGKPDCNAYWFLAAEVMCCGIAACAVPYRNVGGYPGASRGMAWSTAATGQNGHSGIFAGSSTAELEQWLVRPADAAQPHMVCLFDRHLLTHSGSCCTGSCSPGSLQLQAVRPSDLSLLSSSTAAA